MKARALVTITPISGSRIRFRVHGHIHCSQLGQEIHNSIIVSKDDGFALLVFGGKKQVDRFLHRNRSIRRVTSLELLGYDSCDRLS